MCPDGPDQADDRENVDSCDDYDAAQPQYVRGGGGGGGGGRSLAGSSLRGFPPG